MIGYAVYYFNYEMERGRGCYLEDLYIQEKYRRMGLGTLLWREVIEDCLKNYNANFNFFSTNTGTTLFCLARFQGTSATVFQHGINTNFRRRIQLDSADKVNIFFGANGGFFNATPAQFYHHTHTHTHTTHTHTRHHPSLSI